MKAKIAYFGKHFGEEPPISGTNGSGTIFFSGCNLHCQFCQNYQISQEWTGRQYSEMELAEIMIGLQNENAHNINLVTPSLWINQIKNAIIIAKTNGLKIPIVYNTNAYERPGDLLKLKGLIDIFLPDFKYSINALAEKYSKVKNYKEIANKNILEMIAYQPENIFDQGIMKKGVIVRHLILPNNVKNTLNALKIIRSFSDNIIISLMTQYEPLYKANNFPEINQNVCQEEYDIIFKKLENLNFENGWIQPLETKANKNLIPDFNKDEPFN